MALLLLIMFNHCFELRTEYPQLFLLGAIKEKLYYFVFLEQAYTHYIEVKFH